jgi:hypothetical protein
MPTLTSNVMTFDQSLYQALNAQAVKYIKEDPQLNWIKQAVITPIDAPEYKKPIFGNSVGVTGQTKLGLGNQQMTTPKSHYVYNLNYVRGDIYYDVNDMMTEGQYLVQRKAQELSTWEDQVKQAIFKGVRTGVPTAASPIATMYDADGLGKGAVLNTGIIEQATLVEDLDGTNSQLIAAGDVYKALSKMLGSIPFRFRDGRRVVIGVDDLFVRNARRALYRGATNQISELDLFLSENSGPMGQQGNIVLPRLIVSDKLFLNQVVGTTKTEADTKGTHSRIFMTVEDPAGEILEQAYSRFGMVGEDRYNSIQSVVQNWSARCSGCVHQPTAVVYSEQITWA